MAKKMTSLDELYVDLLKDLYSAENQLVNALPKMVKAASASDLRDAFEGHLRQFLLIGATASRKEKNVSRWRDLSKKVKR